MFLCTDPSAEQLPILYEARGQEIEILKDEISSLTFSKIEKISQLHHENYLLKRKNKRLEAESNQIQSINEDNQNLREKICDLKNKLKQSEVLRQELENSNQLVQQLQVQISELQESASISSDFYMIPEFCCDQLLDILDRILRIFKLSYNIADSHVI